MKQFISTAAHPLNDLSCYCYTHIYLFIYTKRIPNELQKKFSIEGKSEREKEKRRKYYKILSYSVDSTFRLHLFHFM